MTAQMQQMNRPIAVGFLMLMVVLSLIGTHVWFIFWFIAVWFSYLVLVRGCDAAWSVGNSIAMLFTVAPAYFMLKWIFG